MQKCHVFLTVVEKINFHFQITKMVPEKFLLEFSCSNLFTCNFCYFTLVYFYFIKRVLEKLTEERLPTNKGEVEFDL
jgi:hypothetical protein